MSALLILIPVITSVLSPASKIMLKTIKIKNFRSFQSFELQQLGRVNLLVGKNNTGKTSILEAMALAYIACLIINESRLNCFNNKAYRRL